MKKKVPEKVDSFDRLATLIVGEIQDLREEINERFEKVDQQFEKVDQRFEKVDQELVNIKIEMRNGFDETKKIIDRHDTRISALEYKSFGASDSQKISN
jgi:uncharacterized coiled-coil DUF342 family protein